MFKKIYLVLILAGLAAAQTNFEIATKKYLQDMGDKNVPKLYEKSCREDKNAVGCYIAAQLKAYQTYDLKDDDEYVRINGEVFELYKSACDLGYAKACSAAGDLGSPGIFIIAPHNATINPAPAETVIPRTLMVKPSGLPSSLALSLSEYCVFAMQIGSLSKPSRSKLAISAAASALNVTPAAP